MAQDPTLFKYFKAPSSYVSQSQPQSDDSNHSDLDDDIPIFKILNDIQWVDPVRWRLRLWIRNSIGKKKKKQRKAKYAEPIKKAVQKPIQKPVAVYQGADGEDQGYYDEQRDLWLPKEIVEDLKEEEDGSSTESNGNADGNDDGNDDGNAQGAESESQDEQWMALSIHGVCGRDGVQGRHRWDTPKQHFVWIKCKYFRNS